MEILLPLIIGVFLAYFLARWGYRKESTKFRKISAAFLGAVFGFFAPLIAAAMIMAPKETPRTKEETVMAKLSHSIDGCPLEMKNKIKELMNDPDSFKCIETNIIKRKDDYVLVMQFNGKNQYGGTVKNVAKAEYNSDGIFVKFVE